MRAAPSAHGGGDRDDADHRIDAYAARRSAQRSPKMMAATRRTLACAARRSAALPAHGGGDEPNEADTGVRRPQKRAALSAYGPGDGDEADRTP